jgi:hypothetical protein
MYVLPEAGGWKDKVHGNQDQETVQYQETLHLPDNLLCVCGDLWFVICTVHWADHQGHEAETLRPPSEVKRKEDGVGAHFFHHAEELGISLDTDMEDIMQYFNLTIIASVEPDMPWSRDRLDTLEPHMMERKITMENYGCINLRVERRRGHSYIYLKRFL